MPGADAPRCAVDPCRVVLLASLLSSSPLSLPLSSRLEIERTPQPASVTAQTKRDTERNTPTV